MEVIINVINQKLKVQTNLKKYISGTQKFIRFRFNLPSEWNDLLIFAQFNQNGNVYNVYLDDSNSVYLPPEIVAGKCTLMLRGNYEEIIGITDYIELTIDENILVSDSSSTSISVTLYEQLSDKVQAIEDALTWIDF